MKKLATQILDVKDDKQGQILREYFDDYESVPEVIKTASFSDDLPDDQYALVMLNDGDKYRKYPVNDVGNTMLSALYLTKQAHLLPPEAVKLAADNISDACLRHKIEVPEQVKEMAKEVPAGVEVRLRERYWKTPQSLDVSKLEAPTSKEKKAATHTLLGDDYPVDTYEQIKLATDYFRDYWRELEPKDRFAYCQKLASRMEDLDISVPKDIERYGSPGYSHDLKMHIDQRKGLTEEMGLDDAYETMYQKKNQVHPTTFAETLSELDKVAGLHTKWDSKIYDPYKTTFGPSLEKLANEAKKMAWCYNQNGVYIDEDKLYTCANNRRPIIVKQFGEAFADKFFKSPVSAFESLSDRSQVILARIASNEFQS